MRVPIGTSAFDKLKNEPRHRFAYWYDEGFLGKVLDSGEIPRLGERTLADVFGHALYRADWSAFDRAAEPPCADGLQPVDRVDVGYGEDEVRTGFGPVDGRLIAKDAVRVDVRGEFAVFSLWACQ